MAVIAVSPSASRRRVAASSRCTAAALPRQNAQPLTDLAGDLETPPRGLRSRPLTGASLTYPPPHRPLGDPQRAGCRPDLARAQPARVRLGGQASHDRLAARPIHGARNLPAHPAC